MHFTTAVSIVALAATVVSATSYRLRVTSEELGDFYVDALGKVATASTASERAQPATFTLESVDEKRTDGKREALLFADDALCSLIGRTRILACGARARPNDEPDASVLLAAIADSDSLEVTDEWASKFSISYDPDTKEAALSAKATFSHSVKLFLDPVAALILHGEV